MVENLGDSTYATGKINLLVSWSFELYNPAFHLVFLNQTYSKPLSKLTFSEFGWILILTPIFCILRKKRDPRTEEKDDDKVGNC